MDEWLTLSQAAALVGCSRKTLYRYMTRNLLSYRREADNRRYVSKLEVLSLFETRRHTVSQDAPTHDASTITHALLDVKQTLDEHNALLIRMIELYQPRTLSELAKKHV